MIAMNCPKFIWICVWILVVVGMPGMVCSQGLDSQAAQADYLAPFLVASELALALDSDNGIHKAWKGGQALVATYAAVEVLKNIFKEPRPDRSDNKSFPSGHSALAFTAASVLDISQPGSEQLAYPCAGYIAWSRVETRKHYWRDVIAGAVVGHIFGRQFAYKDKNEPIQLGVSFAF